MLDPQIVMKDRLTGRPRGFGFMTLADESAADRVCSETHVLDGRQVSDRPSQAGCRLMLPVAISAYVKWSVVHSSMPSDQYHKSTSPAARRSLLVGLRQRPQRVGLLAPYLLALGLCAALTYSSS